MSINLSVLGFNHLTSTIDLREHISFPKETMAEALQRLNKLPGLEQGLIVSTCNRMEIYYCGEIEKDVLINWLSEFHHVEPASIRVCSYHHKGKRALSHLIRVGMGLESMALGEAQVLGQLKESYKIAKESGYIHGNCDSVMQFAFSIIKKVRTQTKIGESSLGMAATAVNLGDKALNGLKDKSVLVIGAGHNALLIIKYLQEKQLKQLYIANRTYQKSADLAKQYSGDSIPLIDIAKFLPHVDAIFTSTSSPTILVGKGMVESAVRRMGGKPVFICDMSLPHDVEDSVRDLDQIHLYNLSDMEVILQSNHMLKTQEKQKAEKIIEEEINKYLKQNSHTGNILKKYRSEVDELKQSVLDKMIDGATDEQTKKKLTALADNLVAKMTHGPTVMIKDIVEGEDTQALDYVRKNLLTQGEGSGNGKAIDKDGGQAMNTDSGTDSAKDSDEDSAKDSGKDSDSTSSKNTSTNPGPNTKAEEQRGK